MRMRVVAHRTCLAGLLLVTIPALASARDRRGPGLRPPDACGDPAVVDQAYEGAAGRVLEVTSGDRIRVEMKPIGRYRSPTVPDGVHDFRLVAVEAPPVDEELGRRSRDQLAGRLLGRNVWLSLSPVQKEGMPVNAMVSLAGDLSTDPALPIDENERQIATGLARAVEQGDYDVDWWVRCRYQRAEAAARAAHRGLWGDVTAPPRAPDGDASKPPSR